MTSRGEHPPIFVPFSPSAVPKSADLRASPPAPDSTHPATGVVVFWMDSTNTDLRSPGNDSAPHLGMPSSSRRSDFTHRRTTATATASGCRPSSALAQQLASCPLPVIKCDHCPRLVLRQVSSTPEHPGWVFFKCEKDGEGCKFWYWEEEYIDLLIARNLLDVRALLARDETREDAMSKFVETEKINMRAQEPIDKSNNVGNEDIEKALIGLVGAVREQCRQ